MWRNREHRYGLVSILLHWTIALGIIELVALHAGAALKHHFVDKGSTLARMVVLRTRRR